MDARNQWFLGAALAALVCTSSLAAELEKGQPEKPARHRDAPEFKVDADWPKVLPNQRLPVWPSTATTRSGSSSAAAR